MNAANIILMGAWPPILTMEHLAQMGLDAQFVRQYGGAEYHKRWERGQVSVPPIPMLLKYGDNTKLFVQAKLMEWLEMWFSAPVVRERLAEEGQEGGGRKGRVKE